MKDKIIVEKLGLKYGDGTESLFGVNMRIQANKITALIGPAGGENQLFCVY